jgi:hypothetical protein
MMLIAKVYFMLIILGAEIFVISKQLVSFSLFGGTGDWTQGLTHASKHSTWATALSFVFLEIFTSIT